MQNQQPKQSRASKEDNAEHKLRSFDQKLKLI
jgi:hypothetical protein